jgi:IclR family KDG regulon transcriptional repressor
VSNTVRIISQIFSIFSVVKEEIGIREVSNILGIYPSRVHWVMKSLEVYGFLEKGPNKKYRLGEKLLELGTLYPIHFPLRKIVRPHGEELAMKFRSNVSLGILSKKDPPSVIIIDRIFNYQSAPFIHRLSFNIPLHCTGIGKCILAFMPPEMRKETLKKISFTKYTDQTITDFKSLDKEIHSIIKDGFAVDRMEMQEDLYSVAVPLFSNQNLVGSMCVMDTPDRITPKKVPQIAKALIDKAKFISRQL